MIDALIINAVVLTVVLESDLGRHRKINWFRIGRPLVTALIVIPFFVEGVEVSGAGLVLEVASTSVGLALGWLSISFMTVYRSPTTGRPVTSAGAAYAVVWIVVSAARVLFAYGSQHWFENPLGSWMARNGVSAGGLTDSLIFMALAMVITRVAVMAYRARQLPAATSSTVAPA